MKLFQRLLMMAKYALSLNFLSPTEVLDPRITFTRASAGTRFNSAGLLETMTDNAPRFDYDPATPVGVTGDELVGNTNFSDDSWWSQTGLIYGGKLNIVTTGAYVGATKNAVLTVGKTYFVSADVVINAGPNGVAVGCAGGSASVSRGTTGTLSGYFVADTATLEIKRNAAGQNLDATVDNISVREATMAPRGLLIEEQRTNLVVATDGFFGTTQGAGTVRVVSTLPAPTGAVEGWRFQNCDGALAWLGANTASGQVNATASSPYTVSAYFKSGGATQVQLGARDQSTGNISSSALTTISAEWTRITVSLTTGAATSQVGFIIGRANGDVLVWGMQIEAGAFPTSYIPTPTAAATRAADSAVMTGANFSSWYNQTQGTFVTASDQTVYSGGSNFLFSADDGTSTNRLFASTNSGNRAYLVDAGGVSQVSIGGVAPVLSGFPSNSAFAYAINDYAASTDGLAAVTDTSGLVPTVDRLRFGASSSGAAVAALNGHIRSIKYFKSRLTNAQLQALTS